MVSHILKPLCVVLLCFSLVSSTFLRGPAPDALAPANSGSFNSISGPTGVTAASGPASASGSSSASGSASATTGPAAATGSSSGPASATASATQVVSSADLSTSVANKLQCSSLKTEKQFKDCMFLLADLNLEINNIISLNKDTDRIIDVPSVGSSLDKANFVCGSSRDQLNEAQKLKCDKLHDQYQAQIGAVEAGEPDLGFCRTNVPLPKRLACLAMMNLVAGAVKTIAGISDPPVSTLSKGSPLDIAKDLCAVKIGQLNDAQKAACEELKDKVVQEQTKLGLAAPAKEDPCASVANNTEALELCRSLTSGKVPPKAKEPCNSTAAVTVNTPSVASSYCDNVPAVNLEVCKKWLIKVRFDILSIATKAGLTQNLEPNGPLNGLTAQKFLKQVCDQVTSADQLAECKAATELVAQQSTQIVSGPVPASFASNQNTTEAKPAEKPAPISVEERSSVCEKIEQLSPKGSTNGALCDIQIRDVKKLVTDALEANPKAKAALVEKPELKQPSRSLDKCVQISATPDSSAGMDAAKLCVDKVSVIRDSIKKLLAELRATSASGASGISGTTGASGASGASAASGSEGSVSSSAAAVLAVDGSAGGVVGSNAAVGAVAGGNAGADTIVTPAAGVQGGASGDVSPAQPTVNTVPL